MPSNHQINAELHYRLKFDKALAVALAIVVVGLGLSRAAAEPFSQMVVFGDGFSDHGNVFFASSGVVPTSPPNTEGRLSNGRLWVEQLADRFALTLNPVLAGGTNYAYIGAKVNADAAIPGDP